MFIGAKPSVYNLKTRPMTNIKHDIRADMQAVLKEKTAQACLNAGEQVAERLNAIASVAYADTVMVNLPIAGEIDLCTLIQHWIDESRVVCVPVVDWDAQTMKAGLLTGLNKAELTLDQHGIHTPARFSPVPHDTIEVVIVPGIAFTTDGVRLGRGGGYYDKFLSTFAPPIILGVCFDEQIVSALPEESHDVRMTAVITPTQTYV